MEGGHNLWPPPLFEITRCDFKSANAISIRSLIATAPRSTGRAAGELAMPGERRADARWQGGLKLDHLLDPIQATGDRDAQE